MKVLLFNHAFFNLSETFVFQQVKGMPEDIEVILMGFDFRNEDVFKLNNEKIRIRRSANLFDRMMLAAKKRIFNKRGSLGLFSSNKIAKLIKDSGAQLVHAHFGFNALLIYPIVRSLNIPLVITFHGLDASPLYLKNKRYRRRVHEMIDYAYAVIIVSPHMKDTLDLSAYSEKTHLVPCGVDPDEFAPRTPAERNVINILHSGRIVSKKGVGDLIRVFTLLNRKYPHTRLHIVGEGPHLQRCRNLAADATPGSIVFHGARPHGEVKKIMSEADIFVLNSRTSNSGDMEGLPVSILEAMSMSLPVVSTYHAGIPYVITNEKDGLLVKEKDKGQLAAALEKLINNADLRRQLGAAARGTVTERFTTEQVNRRIADLYRQIAGLHRKGLLA